MLFADERSIVVRGVRGHSSFPRTSRLHETSKEFWVNAALNEDSAGTQQISPWEREKDAISKSHNYHWV